MTVKELIDALQNLLNNNAATNEMPVEVENPDDPGATWVTSELTVEDGAVIIGLADEDSDGEDN